MPAKAQQTAKTDKQRSWLSSINWIWCVITLLVFSLLIKLGSWQLTRAEEKEQRLARINELVGNEHQSLERVISALSDELELNDQPVLLNGTFEDEVLILHDNQTLNGQLGYRVYQLFNHQNQMPVLINLGWIKGSKDRSVIPNVEALTGTYQIKGNIRIVESPMVLATQSYQWQPNIPLRVQQIDTDVMSEILDQQLLPFVVYVDTNETIGYQKSWQPIVMPPEKHRGYAFQWFSLAIAWLVLMIVAAFKNNKQAEINE